MTKQQAISRIENELYLPEDGLTFSWTAFQSEGGEYALWLIGEDGVGLLAKPGEPLLAADAGEHGVGEFDENGIPLTLEGYERLPLNRTVPLITPLSQINFGEDEATVRISSLQVAAELEPKYQYDSAEDAIVDQETGTMYRPVEGTFVSDDGTELSPGYIVYVGLEHFDYFLVLENPSLTC
jgi:hypothetical protein